VKKYRPATITLSRQESRLDMLEFIELSIVEISANPPRKSSIFDCSGLELEIAFESSGITLPKEKVA